MAQRVTLFTHGSMFRDGDIERDFAGVVERSETRLTDVNSAEAIKPLVRDATVIVHRNCPITREVMLAAPRLRGIVHTGVGVDLIDVPAATELGIVVANAPGNSVAVAEATMLLILALSKRFTFWLRLAKEEREVDIGEVGFEVDGKTLGLVGLGRIGRLVAVRARAHGMNVLACDPYVTSSDLAQLVSLEELLRRSDLVSLHSVLNPATRGMIGARELALMKPSAYLINTSRGGVVDEVALIEALRAGSIAGAALDVFEVEPPRRDNPLLAMDNVICTPHALPRTLESVWRNLRMVHEGAVALLDGRLPEYTVNRDVKPRFLST
ncbi:MAG: hydroxyacid dehydrogenase [Chloroflexi bacterium]|nr:hydroxyacid dehydrogenase [Chloroflexota bacterium]